jgi:hypothetical protein
MLSPQRFGSLMPYDGCAFRDSAVLADSRFGGRSLGGAGTTPGAWAGFGTRNSVGDLLQIWLRQLAEAH